MSNKTEIGLKQLNGMFIEGELDKSAEAIKDHRRGWKLIYKDEKNLDDPRILKGASSVLVSRVALYTKRNF